MSSIIQKVLDRTGHPELLRVLRDLSGSELNSLLLELFHEKTKTISAPRLLRNYQLNRFVKPAELPVLPLKETEYDLLKIFKASSFEPIELSPVTALGSCSVVAPANQSKILSALRGTEVLADGTNAMALHISDLKKRSCWVPKFPSDKMRLATIQRHVRTQPITGKGFTPHFKIGCFATSGMDTGNLMFERESMLEHVQLMKRIFENYYKVERMSLRLLCRTGYPDSFQLAKAVENYLSANISNIRLDIVDRPEPHTAYYRGLQYKVDIQWKQQTFEIGDGGFVDWTQQLLQNKKERFLISGFGFEFMYRIINGLI